MRECAPHCERVAGSSSSTPASSWRCPMQSERFDTGTRSMLQEGRGLSRELVGHPSAERERQYARVRKLRPRPAMRRPFRAVLRAFLAASRPCLAMHCPFSATRRWFVGHRHPRRAALRASIGHRRPRRAALRASIGHRRPRRATLRVFLGTCRPSVLMHSPLLAIRRTFLAMRRVSVGGRCPRRATLPLVQMNGYRVTYGGSARRDRWRTRWIGRRGH